jgi:ABC-2 type transport system permease protein
MNRIQKLYLRLGCIFRHELRIFAKRPIFLFCMIVAPVCIIFFFSYMMNAGLPTDLPAGIVDEDNTSVTRILTRVLDAFEETDVKYVYKNFHDARKAMQEGKIYGFYYLPKQTTKDAESSRQPKLSFYTNDCYYVPGNLLFKDMKTASELIPLALTRETLYGNGYTEREALKVLQPITLETHPINNPMLNYSVYLSNMLVPGIIILLILLSTTYTIGLEWKQETQHLWYRVAGENPIVALTGKLFPQTIIFCLLMIFKDVYFFQFLGYPCHCGIWAMIRLSVLTVLASQGFGIFLFGIMAGMMRLSMCICALWGILSFSLAGFTYPVTAMDPILRMLAPLFPLRHYYLIYVNQALYGFPIKYVWSSVVALFVFVFLPILVMPRYRWAFEHVKYKA